MKLKIRQPINLCKLLFLHHIVTNFFSVALGDVVVISPNNKTLEVFIDYELGFAPSVASDGIVGKLVLANPVDACKPIESPPQVPNRNTTKWFALISRYPCSFQTKVINAKNAGFDAAIIYNVDSASIRKYGNLLLFSSHDSSVDIPAVLVSNDDGITLKSQYLYDKGFYILLLPDLPFNLNAYLLPFAIVIGVCLLLMIAFMVFQVVKCFRDRRRRRRHRLSSKHLKQLPTTRYQKGDHYDTCAICLEEYIEGEKLRVLPCNHLYHVKCIDPWLTKNRRNCPVCKGKVRLPGMSDLSDTDSETELQPHHNQGHASSINPNHTGGEEVEANERTPLLNARVSSNRRQNSSTNPPNNNSTANSASSTRPSRTRRLRNAFLRRQLPREALNDVTVAPEVRNSTSSIASGDSMENGIMILAPGAHSVNADVLGASITHASPGSQTTSTQNPSSTSRAAEHDNNTTTVSSNSRHTRSGNVALV